MFQHQLLALTGFTLILFPGLSLAGVVTKAGSALFQENYEGITVGTAPNGAASPGPGSWADIFVTAGGTINAVNGSVFPDPSPLQGTRAIKLVRTTATGNAEASMRLSTSQTTGMLSFQFGIYIPSGQGADKFIAQSQYTAGPNSASNRAIYDFLGDGRVAVLDTVNPDSGVPANRRVVGNALLDAWNTFRFEFDLDTGDFTGELNGAAIGGHNFVTDLGNPVSSVGTITNVNLRAGEPNTTFYADAVPEPSSVLFLGLVAGAMICYQLGKKTLGTKRR